MNVLPEMEFCSRNFVFDWPLAANRAMISRHFVGGAMHPRDGCMVAIPVGEPGAAMVRLHIEEDARRILRALNGNWPERVVNAENETDILGVVVFRGRGV